MRSTALMAAFDKLLQLVGVALFALPGAALVGLLPAQRRLHWSRRLAHAYLLGAAWVAGTLYAASHFLAVPLRRPAILTAAAVPILAWLAVFLRRKPGDAPARAGVKRRCTGLELTALAMASLVFLVVLADALIYPLQDWDGRMTWATQARYLRAEGTVNPDVLTQHGWYVNHPWYPVLMPVAQVAVLELLRAGQDEHLFRGFYAFLFPVWLLTVYGGARRWTGRSTAALTALAAALLPFPAFHREGGAAGAYSDLPLACFYGAGLLLLLKARPKLSDGLAAGLLLAAAALTKNEGSLLALWALAVAFFARSPGPLSDLRRRFSRRWQPFAAAAGIVAAALILLVSWRYGIPDRFQSYQRVMSWDELWPGVMVRIPGLLPSLWHELADWDFFWLAAFLVLLAGWRGLRRRGVPALALAVAAPLGIAWIAYSVSLRPDDLVRMSWNRFLLQASVPGLVLFACALDDLLRRASWLPPAFGGPARSPSPCPDRGAGNPASGAPSTAAPDPPTASG